MSETKTVSTDREAILDRAKAIVTGERELSYGPPERNFEAIAGMWREYLKSAGISLNPIETKDVAAMLALVKIARIASGNGKADNWVDLAGYAACGGELEAME